MAVLSNNSLQNVTETPQFVNIKVEVWVSSLLCTVLISLVGLMAVIVTPFFGKRIFKYLLQFLVAMAVGTLLGDAFLHLFPHAFSIVLFQNGIDITDEYVERSLVNLMVMALVGFGCFFNAEKVVVLVTEYRIEKRHRKADQLKSHRHAPENISANQPMRGSLNSIDNTAKDRIAPDPKQNEKRCYMEENLEYVTKMGSETRDFKAKIEPVSVGIGHKALVSLDEIRRQEECDNNNIPGCPRDPAILGINVGNIESQSLLENIVPLGDVVVQHEPASKKRDAPLDQAFVKEVHDQQANNSSQVVIKLNELSSSSNSKETSEPHTASAATHGHTHEVPGSIQAVMTMVILGDGLHNLTDGMAVGAAFSHSISGGISTAVAVLCHELPHELGDFAALLSAGMKFPTAVFYNMVSSVLCLLGVFIGVGLGNLENFNYIVFAMAGGIFTYIALVNLLPDLSAVKRKRGESYFLHFILHNSGIFTGITLMYVIAAYEHDFKVYFNRLLEGT